MTDILNMTDDELATAAAEAFTLEGERKHDLNKQDGGDRTCTKCGRTTYRCGCFQNGLESNKTHPDPLDVTDLGLAMRTFREVFESKSVFELNQAVLFVAPEEYNVSHSRLDQYAVSLGYIVFKATPQQIWRIILLAKKEIKK